MASTYGRILDLVRNGLNERLDLGKRMREDERKDSFLYLHLSCKRKGAEEKETCSVYMDRMKAIFKWDLSLLG